MNIHSLRLSAVTLSFACLFFGVQAANAATVTEAIDAGKRFLLSVQKEDGSWVEERGGGPVSPTALATLSLLAADETSTRDATRKAAEWLLSRQRANGQFGDNMVDHATSVLALSQFLQMRNPPDLGESLREALLKAVAFSVDVQNSRKARDADRGGWHHQPSFDRSDLYYSGWQIFSLAAADQAGIPVEREIFQKALDFVRRSRQKEGYGVQPMFSEASSRSYRSHTGVALAAGRIAAANPRELEEEEVLEWMDAVPPTWGGAQYRGHFFGMIFFQAQAYRHLDGARWKQYETRLYPLMLREQKGDGSWKIQSEGMDEQEVPQAEGEVTSTALAVLTLSVEEKRLPIFWPREPLLGAPIKN